MLLLTGRRRRRQAPSGPIWVIFSIVGDCASERVEQDKVSIRDGRTIVSRWTVGMGWVNSRPAKPDSRHSVQTRDHVNDEPPFFVS